MEAQVIVVKTENVTGHLIVRMLRQCFGIVVRSRGLGDNMMAGLRSIAGDDTCNTMSEIVAHGTAAVIEPAP
jgi:uncharacterized protein YbjQ (UPF0145 family)